MLTKLTDVETQGLTFNEYYRHYFPGATNQEIDFFLWECTPFPFDNRKTIDAIYQKYKATFRELNGSTPDN